MADITEIAAETYRISIYVPEIDLQFNHFLVRDEQPLLFHAGLRRLFPEVHEAVRTLLDPARIRYISFSHFESDECGALNEWLAQAPQAEPVSGLVGAVVNLNDFASRPARALSREETLHTGRHRFRFISTPQVPHGWDAGVLFDETERILFCSDLFHQWGDVEALTESSVLERVQEALRRIESGPLARYVPYTHHTGGILEDLSRLDPRTLAIQHGSSFRGNGAAALRDLAEIWRTTLGPPAREQVAGPASRQQQRFAGTLYERLGGYDTIAAIVDDLLAMLREDPRFGRFVMERSLDSHQRARQLLVDQLCALAGGPCFYVGRDMKTSHAGLGITESEWNANLEYAIAALKKNGVPQAEQGEFLSLFTRYREEIVERSPAQARDQPLDR
ncbi:MAG TPA: hypothetical protein VFA54_16630 [Bryobacterales bacterium]|nr:hypothetical protein [Bryobacterales bacterium]